MVVLATITVADAQSLQSKKISFCCNSSDFETVIEDLSKATGVHFVYSSNKISTSQQINVSVKDKPLSEVLDLLSKQMNLSFKIQEHYITVKSRAVQYQALRSELISLKAFAPQHVTLSEHSAQDAERQFGPFVTEKIANATELPSKDGDIAPYVAKLKPYFDPTFLKKIPIRYLKSTTKKLNVDNNWFITVGSVVNDYSAGVEIQAGLRYAYVAFTPAWLRDSQYHGGLGIGTSLQLSNLFSLRPVYSFASMKETGMDHVNSMFAKSPSYQVNTTTSHHQFKLMLQYDVSKKFKFRAGPTFNQTRATSTYQSMETTYYRTGSPQSNPPDRDAPHGVFHRNSAPQPGSVTSSKFWVGWEASLSYRINFK